MREFRLSEAFARFRRTIFFGAIFDIIPSAETDQSIADMLSPFISAMPLKTNIKIFVSPFILTRRKIENRAGPRK